MPESVSRQQQPSQKGPRPCRQSPAQHVRNSENYSHFHSAALSRESQTARTFACQPPLCSFSEFRSRPDSAIQVVAQPMSSIFQGTKGLFSTTPRAVAAQNPPDSAHYPSDGQTISFQQPDAFHSNDVCPTDFIGESISRSPPVVKSPAFRNLRIAISSQSHTTPHRQWTSHAANPPV